MPKNDRQLERVRERYRTSSPPPRSRVALFFRFLSLSVAKARDDVLPTQSAALAFITILSLVPLLASLSHFSAGFFTNRQDELVNLLSRVLPYTESSIDEQLKLFVEHSGSLRGFGLVGFLLTALTAFGMIERTINDIWAVPHRRPWRSQLNSFILLIAWGPLLIGATYSGLFLLRQQPTFDLLVGSVPLHLITFGATVLGLSMLNWQVPYTHVEFRHALVGGSTSAVLLELLRSTFTIYADRVPQMSLVYGSFGFALFFMISIQIAWAIVLLGTELAYCVQNYDAMSSPRRKVESLEGGWLSLAVLTLIIDRFRHHEPVTSHDVLAGHFGLSVDQLRKVLYPLVEARYVRETLGEVDGYLLACDPHQVQVKDVLDLYEPEQWHILHNLPEASAAKLETLRARVVTARSDAVAGSSLADLAPSEPPDAESSPKQ